MYLQEILEIAPISRDQKIERLIIKIKEKYGKDDTDMNYYFSVQKPKSVGFEAFKTMKLFPFFVQKPRGQIIGQYCQENWRQACQNP